MLQKPRHVRTNNNRSDPSLLHSTNGYQRCPCQAVTEEWWIKKQDVIRLRNTAQLLRERFMKESEKTGVAPIDFGENGSFCSHTQ